ncbi:MAG: hypothetical protein QM790_06480 [Nibricoccus sp.]
MKIKIGIFRSRSHPWYPPWPPSRRRLLAVVLVLVGGLVSLIAGANVAEGDPRFRPVAVGALILMLGGYGITLLRQ